MLWLCYKLPTSTEHYGYGFLLAIFLFVTVAMLGI